MNSLLESRQSSVAADRRTQEVRCFDGSIIQIRVLAVSVRVMSSFLRDLRFAFRTLLRKPGFTMLVVLTLALGIGLASAVFALVDGVLFTPPPYPRPERLLCISSGKMNARDDGQCAISDWLAWRNEAKSFDAIAAYAWIFDYLVRPDGSRFIQGLRATTNYFDVVGIKPLMGRTFLPSEISAKPAPVVILGYDLWKRDFAGDPQILGKSIHISRRDEPLTVVGVMPAGLRFLPAATDLGEPNYDVNAPVDYWMPAWLDENKLEGERCDVAGRLRAGVTQTQAQAELIAIANRHGKENGTTEAIQVKVESLVSVLNREGLRLLAPLSGAVLLLFLIACGNAAGLLLARGLQRQQEYMVRRALGAQWTQLFCLVIAEALWLALFAGGFGLMLAAGIVKIFKIIGGVAIPRLDAVTIGWPVIAVCLGLALAAAAFSGLIPALHALRLNPASGIKNGGRTGTVGRGERRLLAGVAVLQITLTLALLVGAVLLVRTVRKLTAMDPGYDTKNVLTMSVTTMADSDRFVDFHMQALERISTLPGVTKAAFAWGVPLTGNKWSGPVSVEGESETNEFDEKPAVGERSVTPDYFDALGMHLIEGRGFRASDNWNNWTNKAVAAPGDIPFVAIINQAMAEQRFHRVSPIGRKLRWKMWAKRPAEVIGIVKDIRDERLADKAEPEVYFCYWQVPAFTKHLLVKADVNPLSLRPAVERELRGIDPSAAIDHVKTLNQIRADSIAPQTFAMELLIGFSFGGSVLALVGIYGVLSLSVGSRRREIAIRMAVGAQRRNVLGLVLSEGLKLIVIGFVIGTGVAIALARVLRAFLFGVEPTDAITFVCAAILFTAVALLACFIPARRATKIDPMTALRHE